MAEKDEKRLFLSKQVLMGYGCKNCVWKSYQQCPKGFTQPDEFLDEGYCDELAKFLFSLAEGEDSISAVKEKFHIYVQELQALADHAEFCQLEAEFTRRKNEGATGKELAELQMHMTSMKMWWSRLTDSVVKGLSRIADREQKKDVLQVDHKISLTQIHTLMADAKKSIESEGTKQLEAKSE
jgi:hypothetical protein|tara:strand:+ start:441 stop:986 length:546 start_codon:yes stop_codon:yes gene_type:complete